VTRTEVMAPDAYNISFEGNTVKRRRGAARPA
jgi:hypothetical protein